MSEFITKEYFDEQMNELKKFITGQVQHPDIVTINEACRLLGKSRTAIYKMIDDGKLLATQISPRKKAIDYQSLMRMKQLQDKK